MGDLARRTCRACAGHGEFQIHGLQLLPQLSGWWAAAYERVTEFYVCRPCNGSGLVSTRDRAPAEQLPPAHVSRKPLRSRWAT